MVKLKQINYYHSGKLVIKADDGTKIDILAVDLIMMQLSPKKGVKGITHTFKIDRKHRNKHLTDLSNEWGIGDADMAERVSNVMSVVNGAQYA